MLAVVYIVSLKKHIIIPQQWIMSLTQETLNNIGKASYQSKRIFWSNINVDDDGIPDVTIAPNFQRNIASTFPPNGDDACYIGRVKCYCATEEVCVDIGDGCEMNYLSGVKLVPMVDEYQIKMNDPLSMNVPFKENVSNSK